MNHPNPEAWVPYLYGESRRDVRRELKAHLENCPECRRQVAALRGGQQRLDAWKLPKSRNPEALALRLKWAFAGLLILVAGLAAGRLSERGPDLAELQARVQAEVRAEFRQELTALVQEEVKQASASVLLAAGEDAERLVGACISTLQSQRLDDRRAVEALFQRLEARGVADLASLKRELDTLAINTDVGLRNTAAGLVEVANYRTPPRDPAAEGKSPQ